MPAAFRRISILLLLGAVGSSGLSPVVAQDSNVPWARYVDAVTQLYQLNEERPVWLEDLRVSRSGHAAIRALLQAEVHGLDPADYHGAVLDSVAHRSVGDPLSQVDQHRFDALLSIGLIRYLDDLQFGRLHPLPLDRSGADRGIDLARAILDAISGDSIPQLVAATAPQLAQYRNLQSLLARYRALASNAAPTPGLPPLPVRVGDRYAEAVALRWRLGATGDLDLRAAADLGSRYTAGDAAGMRRFQLRHGLMPTGELDSATAAELAIPFAWRVRQIELALERLRWLPPIGSQPFVAVNVPAFQLFAFDSTGGTGAPALSMRVIVGNALDTRTPVLFERMRYVEFRPYWYLPLSIAQKEILPLLDRDPEYLKRNEMEVVNQRDSVIPDVSIPGVIERISQGTLRVRQRPGTSNPLGLVKFVFPNTEAIYLHGTPRTELFARTRRDFSHGCIRVEDPTTLAGWVLRDRPRWSRSAIVAAQQGSATVRASLSRPMPVVVWYTTAVAAPDGRAWFYADIYGHDRQLDRALQTHTLSASAR